MMPSGPHGVGHFDRVVAERLGSTCYAIDLDPRWVKKVAARSDRRAAAVVTDYVDHVLEQARHILESQRVGNLHATPPLLEAIANNDHLLGLVNRRDPLHPAQWGPRGRGHHGPVPRHLS